MVVEVVVFQEVEVVEPEDIDFHLALQQGVIAGAGLDVYEAEPRLVPGLRELPNVVLLPHMGSGTTQTRAAMGECALANIQAFVENRPLPNQVN